MKDNSPSGKDGSGNRGGDMLAGMTRKSPAGMDSSGTKGGSVNSDTTRSAVGKVGAAPGPREA